MASPSYREGGAAPQFAPHRLRRLPGPPCALGGGRAGSGPRLCRKPSFATQADRLRPRLEDRRLPVAGPAARHPAGRGRRRRGQPLPRPRLRRPRRPAWPRQLPAGPAEGRRARRLELDRLGRHLVNTVQDLSARGVGLRVLAGDGAQIDHHRGRPPGVRHLRGAGRVRAGADPGTHLGRAQGRTGSPTQGRQEVRAVESPGAAGSGRDGAPRHVGVRAVPPTRHQAGDALQVRRTPGPVARTGTEGPRLPNRKTVTPGGPGGEACRVFGGDAGSSERHQRRRVRHGRAAFSAAARSCRRSPFVRARGTGAVGRPVVCRHVSEVGFLLVDGWVSVLGFSASLRGMIFRIP